MKSKEPNPITISGSVWKEFIADPTLWDTGFLDYDEILVNGVALNDQTVNDTDTIKVIAGVYFPTAQYDEAAQNILDILNNWLKNQNTQTLLVKIPKENLENFQKTLKNLKGEIIA